MGDPDRYKITRTLQREANYVAQLATGNFVADAALNPGVRNGPSVGSGDISGLHGSLPRGDENDETRAMMQDGFRRLGGVVALGVLVDEPGLIADDLRWLQRIFSARHIEVADPSWFTTLLAAYLKAAATVLQADEVPLVTDVVDRAISALTQPVF